jgi:hypothetical protein
VPKGTVEEVFLENYYDINNDFNEIAECAKRYKDVPKGTRQVEVKNEE